jgi:two-component system, OmpR family, response regulator RegX3
MPSDNIKILIVEDDVSTLKMMQQMLEIEGYEVSLAVNGETARKIFNTFKPSLALLDIMLPGEDGISLCQSFRRMSKLPIIMVSAKAEVSEKVKALSYGADDYITKPFSYSELLARVSAVLRRTTFPEYQTLQPTFQCYDLRIDFNRHSVTIDGKEIDLTATEFGVLSCLAHRAGRVVTGTEILLEVWGADYEFDTHVLQVTISRLRQKLEAGDYRYIETHTGEGYYMPGQNG